MTPPRMNGERVEENITRLSLDGASLAAACRCRHWTTANFPATLTPQLSPTSAFNTPSHRGNSGHSPRDALTFQSN